MAARTPPRLHPAGVAVLRLSTDPGQWEVPDDLDVFSSEDTEQAVQWLSTLWNRDEVRQALRTASPDLSRQIDDLVGAGGNPQTVRRTVLSALSYVLRWQGRPTPFGLFAGLGTVSIGASAKVRHGDNHQPHIRADAAWLDDAQARLLHCGTLRPRLSVMANTAMRQRGTRIVVPGRAPHGAAGEMAPLEVSIRHSRPVAAVLKHSREPLQVDALHTLLRAQFPHADDRKFDALVVELLRQGVLVSNLSVPLTCLDALGHVRTVLADTCADDIAEISDVTAELAATDEQHSPTTAAERGATRVVDTAVDCDVQIPETVMREARDAVEILFRLSPYPWGHPTWRDYHDRFRQRYGVGAVVPVLELVADSGLGFPAGFLDSPYEREARKISARDERFLELVQRAMVDGSGEIVLTDQLIDELTEGDLAEAMEIPPRVEVAVEIRSDSVEALSRGRFELAVTGTPRAACSMTGRHAHLLVEADRQRLAQTFTAGEPGAIAAQLSFEPRRRRNDNVARTQQLLEHVVSIGEYRRPDPTVISVSDLAVTADERRFRLIQVSTGKRVEPRVTHALEASLQTPPLARFLAEITTARAAVYTPLQVGAASRLAYLPRIRYRRTILTPARWRLTASGLPGTRTSMDEWDQALAAWRGRWHVPDHVALVQGDRRQPLDLRHRLHRRLLRSRLERTDHVELRETAEPQQRGWLGRAHELVIPLVGDQEPNRAAQASRESLSSVKSDDVHVPGHAAILCAHLFGHPSRFDELVTEQLPRLIESFDTDKPRWWFRRYRRMRHPEYDQYLVLNLELAAPSDYGQAAHRVAAWAERTQRERLLASLALVDHHPQLGRYGHGAAIDRAHEVFAADSAAAVAEIAAAQRTGLPAQAIAAASVVDLAVRFAGSIEAGVAWLIDELPHHRGRLDAKLRQHTLELADPSGAHARLHDLPAGEQVTAAWDARGEVLVAYRDELDGQRDPMTVLPALLHGHHNRAVGVDTTTEKITFRLARSCALSYRARYLEA